MVLGKSSGCQVWSQRPWVLGAEKRCFQSRGSKPVSVLSVIFVKQSLFTERGVLSPHLSKSGINWSVPSNSREGAGSWAERGGERTKGTLLCLYGYFEFCTIFTSNLLF